MLVVAVIVPGAMGAAVGRTLASHGAEVGTLLASRSPASPARASAGVKTVDPTGIAEADTGKDAATQVVPGETVALHGRLARDQAGPQRDTGALDAFLHP